MSDPDFSDVVKLLFEGTYPLQVDVKVIPAEANRASVTRNGDTTPEAVTEYEFKSHDGKNLKFETGKGVAYEGSPSFSTTGAALPKEIARNLRQYFDGVRVVHVGEDERYAVIPRGPRIQLAKLAQE